jgi:hypothetical protein
VLHIDSRGDTRPHALTEFAVPLDGGRLEYPAQQHRLDV